MVAWDECCPLQCEDTRAAMGFDLGQQAWQAGILGIGIVPLRQMVLEKMKNIMY